MYYDYHTHSDFSDDSTTPLTDMLDSAIDKGIVEIAVTDHYDPGYPDREFPFELDFDKYHKTLEEMQVKYEGRLRIAKGIEIGIQHDQIDNCHNAATSYDYDYIIGSFHCADGEPLYNGHFYDDKTPLQAYIDYFTYTYENICKFKDFSNLGHMNLVTRYCPVSEIPEFSRYSDICEAILKMLIEEGKGIELNTSSFRYGLDETTPSKDLLKLYHSLGGEIITIGSDAHTPDCLADHFDFARDYLKVLGFRYISVFRNRKPEFIPL